MVTARREGWQWVEADENSPLTSNQELRLLNFVLKLNGPRASNTIAATFSDKPALHNTVANHSFSSSRVFD